MFNGDSYSEMYSGCEFDLTVPDGLSIDTSKKGSKYFVKSSEITKGDVVTAAHTFTIGKNGNVYSFKIMSMDASSGEFVKKSGVLCKIKASAANTMTSGLVNMEITNIWFTASGEHIEENVDTETTETSAVGGAAVAINSAGYATACSAKALDFSAVEGVEAVFTVSKVADGSATLSPIESKKVPATAGVVVKASASETLFVPFAEGSVDALGTNLLKGVTSATAIEEGCYILQGEEFVSCIAGTLPAGKAYLPASVGSSSAKAFTFDFGESTGINEVKTAKADGAIYSISGVRVAEPQKGVYIMNGRKVIVK